MDVTKKIKNEFKEQIKSILTMMLQNGDSVILKTANKISNY
jgi:hypothetical protein